MTIPTITLNDGNKIPIIGFGTGSAFFGKPAANEVLQALRAGFVHIDGAQAYKNEDSIGLAIETLSPPRSSLFVTTKLAYIPEGKTIRYTLVNSLKQLRLEYVDLFLIHSPTFLAPQYTIATAWKECEELQKEGLAKSIGVSNFRASDLEELLDSNPSVAPAVNQIEYHPYTVKSAEPIVTLCKKHGIVMEGYGGLMSLSRRIGGPVDPVVKKIRQRLVDTSGDTSISEGQVLLKWLQGKGMVAITTSSKKERLAEYLATPSLPDLTAEEIAEIDKAGCSGDHYRHFQVMKHMDEVQKSSL